MVGAGLVMAGSVGAQTFTPRVLDDVRGEIEEERTQLRDTVRVTREEVRQTIEDKRQELKDRLAQIRDARKKQIVERFNTRMCEVQKNRVAAMKRHLQTMGNILQRVEEKAAAAKARGKDVLAVEAAVTAAKAAIARAQTAIDAINTQDCGLTISGEVSALRSEINAAWQTLRSQLNTAHESVKEARKAVGEAIRALAEGLGEPAPSPAAQ